jgi:hypothetical protein
VEGVGQDDDLRRVDPALVGALADQLDRALVRLRTGVREEDRAAEGRLGEPLGEPQRRLGVVEVRRTREPRRLLGDRVHDRRVAVACVVDGQTGEEVEILVAVGVPQPGALAADELDRRPDVGRHRVARLEPLEVGDRRHQNTWIALRARPGPA